MPRTWKLPSRDGQVLMAIKDTDMCSAVWPKTEVREETLEAIDAGN